MSALSTPIYQNSDDCTGLDGDIGSGIYNFFRDCHAIINPNTPR